MTAPRKILFSAVKNEGPFLVEWIAYHRVIGFDRIVIVSNDSEDGTTGLLDGLHAAGVIHHIHHSVGPDESPQGKAAQVGNESGLIGDGDWVLWIDADEFLNIHAGQGRVDDLLALMDEAQGMLIPWRLFGDSGNQTFPGRFISRDFTRAAERDFAGNMIIKTFFRHRHGVTALGLIANHRPTLATKHRPSHFLNAAGRHIHSAYPIHRRWLRGVEGKANFNIPPEDYHWELCQINHYTVRSPDVFSLKNARGRGYRNFRRGELRYRDRHTAKFYEQNNRNEAEDISILRHEAATTREIETLMGLPGIAELHQTACQRTAESIAALKVEEVQIADQEKEISSDQRRFSYSLSDNMTVEDENGSDLTFIYIVEPPDYQIMACSLLASIRSFFPKSVRAIGYCPEHRMKELHPAVFKAHELMDAEIRPMKVEGMWDTPYPHGNKILAALQPRDSKYTAFIDSDVLFLRPNSIENLIKAGHVSCSVAASMRWTGQEIWEKIYAVFDMPVPQERIRLMRQNRTPSVPYFSSGLVVFPEKPNSVGRFPDIWYETAQRLDRAEHIDHRRPYLDQMTLPIAIQRAGLHWNILPEEQHYILGGLLRGKAFPHEREIFTIHYRHSKILREIGLHEIAKKLLSHHTGVPYVRRLTSASVI